MIKYDRIWQTMKEKGISQYDLITEHKVNSALLHKLRHNLNIEIYTLEKLCNILDCQIEDIVEHVKDDNLF